MGARPAAVIGMLVRQGMLLALTGLVAGVAAALAVTRLVSSMLIHVSASDPATFVSAALFLGFGCARCPRGCRPAAPRESIR